MSIDITEQARDLTAEDYGEWVESEIFVGKGVKYKVRPFGNPDYVREKSKIDFNKKRKFRGMVDPDWEQDRIGELVARTILVDWVGFTQEYTPKFGVELFSGENRRKYKHVLAEIMDLSLMIGAETQEQMEADAKNSATSSSGKRAGGDTSKR